MPFTDQDFDAPSTWHIICDFDGTISLKDTTDFLLNQFGRPGWIEIEQQWEHGLIGSKSCMQQQIALLDMSEQQLETTLANVEIDLGFLDVVQFCSQHKLQLSIVSDGLDRVISTILKKYQLDHLPIIANHLQQTATHCWQLEFPHADSHCLSQSGTCKCKTSNTTYAMQTILIGDGRSDFCLAEQADVVFAKSSLLHYCQQQHIPHHPFTQLSEIITPLHHLVTDTHVQVDTTRVSA